MKLMRMGLRFLAVTIASRIVGWNSIVSSIFYISMYAVAAVYMFHTVPF